MPNMVGIGASRQPKLTTKDGSVFADSRDVAAFFEKRHNDVLRDIRNILAKAPDLEQRNFAPFKINDLTGVSTSHYEMDRVGFSLLAMGFTGERALRWKLLYVNAFDAMERELSVRMVTVDYGNPAVLLGCFQALQAQVAEKNEAIAVLLPKAEQLDRIAEAHGSHTRTEAAKILGVPPQALCRWMRTNGWTYCRSRDGIDIGHQSKIITGLLEHRLHVVGGPENEWSTTQVRITPKGIAALAKAFPRSATLVSA